MRSMRTVHVVADANGSIVGAAVLNEETSPDPQAQVRIAPLEGQRVIEVELPHEMEGLKTLEDFERLCELFCLSADEDRLVRRERVGHESSKKKARKQKPSKSGSAVEKKARPGR